MSFVIVIIKRTFRVNFKTDRYEHKKIEKRSGPQRGSRYQAN